MNDIQHAQQRRLAGMPGYRARQQNEQQDEMRREAETRAEILSMLIGLARNEIELAKVAGTSDEIYVENAIRRVGFLLALAADQTND